MELILGGVLAIVAIAFFRMTLRTVPQAHVMIIERLGRYHRTLQSGLNIVLPIIDKPSPFLMRRQGQPALQSFVDMREMVLGLDSEQVITRDNVGMGVGSVIYHFGGMVRAFGFSTSAEEYAFTLSIGFVLCWARFVTGTTLHVDGKPPLHGGAFCSRIPARDLQQKAF